MPGEIANQVFDTYKYSVIPHRHHINATLADMSMSTMCTYPPSHHALTRCKFVFSSCSNFPHVDIPEQESDSNHFNKSTSINFYIYHLIPQCTMHDRHPINEKKICRLCFQDLATVTPAIYLTEVKQIAF